MGTEQHPGSAQGLELIMVYGLKTKFLQAVTLYAVMYNISQTIELIAFTQLLLSLAYCREYTETESGFKVNLNLHDSIGCCFKVLFHQPLVLLLNSHVAVVKHDGVIGLAQG